MLTYTSLRRASHDALTVSPSLTSFFTLCDCTKLWFSLIVSFVPSPSSLHCHPKLVMADGCPCSKGVFPPHFHHVLAHRDRLIVGYNIKHLETTVELMLYKYNHTHCRWMPGCQVVECT